MAKNTVQYICQSCGSVYSKWSGRCDACGEWNSLEQEQSFADAVPKGLGKKKGRVLEFSPLSGVSAKLKRTVSNIKEFDRVTGGGLVAGSAVLIGGDPGIGKSTLLLQAVCQLSDITNCCYISGEEAVDQVRMRAARIGFADSNVKLASSTNVRDIVSTLENENIDLVVIDSIQTMYLDNIESAPGTVSQVRASAAELVRVAKRKNIILLLVGHVTKEGQLAGPRVLEHMVDAVLHFEGDRGHQFRILRAIKNRFGPTDEIGVFEMMERGLVEVENPSELFLSQRKEDISGSAVFAGMEGSRPVLVEIQALVAPTSLATPRRAVIGWDSNRLAMVMAVLETRCGIEIGMNDVFLSVAGGLKITEPAADLAVASALLSSIANIAVPSDTIIFGEIGLSGEIRHVGQIEQRLKEASKLGFNSAFVPTTVGRKKTGKNKYNSDITVIELEHLSDILPFFAEL